MDFKLLSLGDIEAVRPFFRYNESRTCDFTVGGLFMWRDFYRAEYAIEDGTFFSRLYNKAGRVYYNIPLSGDPEGALETMRPWGGEDGLRFGTVPEDKLELMARVFRSVTVREQSDLGDYLYDAEQMRTFSGRKFSGQRNQIKHFLNNAEEWSYEALTDSSLEEMIRFFFDEYLTGAGAGDYEREENLKTVEVLRNLESYGMTGGVLRADGAVVGFSLCEKLGDTLYVHIEKASRHHAGAYQMLVNQTANMFATDEIRYINREEDMGDPGLRASKSSYHPAAVLKKYIVEVTD